MSVYEKRYPSQLSGGEKQRIALARSLAKRPKVVLLDEPMAALDKNLRERTQIELVNIQEQIGVTFIMVSHDQEEAMSMSSRIGVVYNGKIVQTGTPTEIYEYPNSTYVAKFIGSINLFTGIVVEEHPTFSIVSPDNIDNYIMTTHSSIAPVGAHVSVAIRPEKITLSKQKPEDSMMYNWTSGHVEDIIYLGDVSTYYVRLHSGMLALATIANTVRATERLITWEDEVYLSWSAENCVILSM